MSSGSGFSVSLVGHPSVAQLAFEMLRHNPRATQLGNTAIALHLSLEDETITVTLNFAAQPDVVEDVLLFLADGRDADTLRFLDDYAWDELAATPDWQPVVAADVAADGHGEPDPLAPEFRALCRRVAALCGVGCVPLTRDGDAGAAAPFVAEFGIVKPPKTFSALLAEDVEKREEKLRARSSPRAAALAFIPTVRRPSVGSAIGGGSPLSMSNNEKLGFTFPGASSAISLCDDGPASVEAHTPGRQFFPGSGSASNASSGYLANRHIRRGTIDSSASAVPSPGGCSPAIESRVA